MESPAKAGLSVSREWPRAREGSSPLTRGVPRKSSAKPYAHSAPQSKPRPLGFARVIYGSPEGSGGAGRFAASRSGRLWASPPRCRLCSDRWPLPPPTSTSRPEAARDEHGCVGIPARQRMAGGVLVEVGSAKSEVRTPEAIGHRPDAELNAIEERQSAAGQGSFHEAPSREATNRRTSSRPASDDGSTGRETGSSRTADNQASARSAYCAAEATAAACRTSQRGQRAAGLQAAEQRGPRHHPEALASGKNFFRSTSRTASAGTCPSGPTAPCSRRSSCSLCSSSAASG